MTFGLPVAAPSGTLAVTRRLVALTGLAPILPRCSSLKSTCATCRRWRPLTWTLEPVVALRTPPHLETQTTSVTLGGSGGVIPPPAAKAQPAHTESEAPTTAAGIAGRRPRLTGAFPWGLKRSL